MVDHGQRYIARIATFVCLETRWAVFPGVDDLGSIRLSGLDLLCLGIEISVDHRGRDVGPAGDGF